MSSSQAAWISLSMTYIKEEHGYTSSVDVLRIGLTIDPSEKK
jgi:hypothetical protein